MPVENISLIIIEPDGPQGKKLALGATQETYQAFSKKVAELPVDQRTDLTQLRQIATELNIPVVRP